MAEAADATPSLRTSAPFGAACVRDCEVLCTDGGHVALALGALAELLVAAAKAVRASARQETRGGGGGGNGSESGSESGSSGSGGAATSKAALQHAQRKVAFLQVSQSHPALAITASSPDHTAPAASQPFPSGLHNSRIITPAGMVGVAAARGAARRVRRAPVCAALRAGAARGDAPRVGGRWRREWRGRGRRGRRELVVLRGCWRAAFSAQAHRGALRAVWPFLGCSADESTHAYGCFLCCFL